jgi:predicted transcriptional regulator
MKDHEIRTLLDLHDQIIDQEDSYWLKIEAWAVGVNKDIPHGVRYSLILKMKIIKIGIASQEKIRERMLAIAKGELKPKPSDPKIWFTSMRSLAEVLSDENRALLDVIRTSRPASISALADLTGRKQGNLSRTLKPMSRYGLVKMEKHERSLRPIARAERYQIMV